MERYIPVSPLFSIRDVLSYSLQQKLPSKGIWHKENEEVQLSGRNQTRRAQRYCSLQTQYTREKEHHSAISILPAPDTTFEVECNRLAFSFQISVRTLLGMDKICVILGILGISRLISTWLTSQLRHIISSSILLGII